MLHRDHGHLAIYLRINAQYAYVAHVRIQAGEVYTGATSLLGHDFKVSHHHRTGRTHAQLVPPRSPRGVQISETNYEAPLVGMKGWCEIGGGASISLADLDWQPNPPKTPKTGKRARVNLVLGGRDDDTWKLPMYTVFAAAEHGNAKAIEQALAALGRPETTLRLLLCYALMDWTDPVFIAGICTLPGEAFRSAMEASERVIESRRALGSSSK